MTVVMHVAHSPMEVFAWIPDNAVVISENGLFQSRAQFGGGYSQVFYKGLARSWELLFWSQSDDELRAIADLIGSRRPFLWTQSPPHDSEGQHSTRARVLYSSEKNDRMTRLECKFDVELIGFQFAEEARLKYGPRDAGMIRD